MMMDDNISGEIRIVQAKIDFNIKQLNKAKEDSNIEQVKRTESNIEQYMKEKEKLERRLSNGKKE